MSDAAVVINQASIPEPVIDIVGEIRNPDGTVIPFNINTEDKDDGINPSNS